MTFDALVGVSVGVAGHMGYQNDQLGTAYTVGVVSDGREAMGEAAEDASADEPPDASVPYATSTGARPQASSLQQPGKRH